MDKFYQAFAIVAALCAGIIILAVFFTALGYFKGAVSATGGTVVATVKGFVREGKRLSVHLNAGRTLSRVQFVGFTGQSSVKGGAIPYQLTHMAVFETEQGARILVRSDSIKMIEEVADAA